MNFTINKKYLLEALNISSKAISNTIPLPILSGIKFIVSKNDNDVDSDHLSLISSDSNISIKNIVKNNEQEIIHIDEEGEIILDNKYILEIVRKMDGDLINFETIDGNYIKIYGINSEYKINGISGNNYPEIDFNNEDNKGIKISFLAEDFFNIVNQTIFACSTSDIKPALTGVNFKAENGILNVTASDSYRIASKKVNLNDEFKDLNFNITIPSKYLNDIVHSIPSTKQIDIIISEQKINFCFGDINIQTRLLDDIFPDTSKFMNINYNQKAILKAKDLINAIDRTSFIKSEGKNIIKMSFEQDNIIITSNDQISSSFEKIPVISFEGEKFEISCSGKYLADALKAIAGEEISLSFQGSLKPFIVKNINDDSIIQLISPVRTY